MIYPSDETMTPDPKAADFCSLGCRCRPNLSPKNRLKKGSTNGSAPPEILTVRVVDIFTIAGLTAADISAMAWPILVKDSTDCGDTLEAAMEFSGKSARHPHRVIPMTSAIITTREGL